MRAAPREPPPPGTRARLADGDAVIAVRAGELGAFRALFDRYRRPLVGLLARMTGRSADAEDLAQQTFVDAFAALARFDTSRQFSAWLFHIAMNKGKDWLKSRKRGEVPLSNEDVMAVTADPEQSCAAREEAAGLVTALGRLAAKYREVLVLRDLHGLPYRDIGVILDLPTTTLKMRVVRGRGLLRKLLVAEKGIA